MKTTKGFWEGTIKTDLTYEKYFYELNITSGFIVGSLIDLVAPCTGGYPIKFLKRFGKCFATFNIKMNKFTNNWFIKGFLE